jgi:hypothetical protein
MIGSSCVVGSGGFLIGFMGLIDLRVFAGPVVGGANVEMTLASAAAGALTGRGEEGNSGLSNKDPAIKHS